MQQLPSVLRPASAGQAGADEPERGQNRPNDRTTERPNEREQKDENGGCSARSQSRSLVAVCRPRSCPRPSLLRVTMSMPKSIEN